MGSVTNLEWENNNSLRSYPFRENSSVESSTNGLSIPPDAVLDFFAFIQAKEADLEFYLSSIDISPDLTSTLHFAGLATGEEVATVTIPLTFTANASFEVVGAGLGTTGKLVAGPGFVSVQRWGIGSFSFLAANSTLEASVAVPLNLGVVTSVGIFSMTRSLVGDVKLEAGRSIREETIIEHNSIIFDAVKSVEDCQNLIAGCPIQSINGIKPDKFGNIVISTEGIITWSPSFNGLHIDGIWSIAQQCPTVFTPGMRGPPGPPGPGGPAGPNGFNVQCSGGICCECQICDECQIGDGILWSPARLIGSNANPSAVNVGATVTIFGVDFTYPPSPGTPWTIAAVLCPKNGAAVPVPFAEPPTFTQAKIVIPAGINIPVAPGNRYGVRLTTPWGYTNSIDLIINPPPPLLLDNMNALGPWVETRGPGFLFSVPNGVGGSNCFNQIAVNPTGAILNNSGLPGLGAAPWNFSGFSALSFMLVKEFYALEAFPADQWILRLTDTLANFWDIAMPVPPSHRKPAPHVLVPPDFQPMVFSLAGAPVNLASIASVRLTTFDPMTVVPLDVWSDNFTGIY